MKYIQSLNKKVIICGDLNVAHKEIDLKNPKSNSRNAGFTIEERNNFNPLINVGQKNPYLVDQHLLEEENA